VEVNVVDSAGTAVPVEVFATVLPGEHKPAAVYVQAVDVRHHWAQREKLNRLAHVDELTGLLNRRGFLAAAEQLLRLARRDRRSVTFLFVDVDGLKAINDRYGHAAGDRAIADAGAILRHVFRDADALGRFGGDEFCVLGLTNRPESTAELRDRLVRAVEDHASSVTTPFDLRVTVGALHVPDAAQMSLEELINAADRAMYSERCDTEPS
jgi:diguanylate cyclase (GGDEF)-like protein